MANNYLNQIFRSELIEINDSEARDYLANERTLLSYIQAAFAILALSIVVSRLNPIQNNFEIIIILFSIAFLTLIVGIIQYFHVKRFLYLRQYPNNPLFVLIILIVYIATFITIIVFLLK